MIAYVIGTITDIDSDEIIVETNQMGLSIKVANGFSFLPDSQVKVYTYTHVKEDAFQLFGFHTKEELALFKKLITVSGVGPKGAQGILSVLSADELLLAIYNQDAAAIAKAPGIGKKTAERVILDLHDKVSIDDLTTPAGLGLAKVATQQSGIAAEAIEALVALGYGQADATRAVGHLDVEALGSTEEVLKKALPYLF